MSTKFVYENLRANELEQHPDIDGMVQAIKDGDLRGITNRMENVLETVTIPAYPVIQEIKDCMKDNGAINALMSGSGPTVFGIYESEEQAERTREVIREKNLAGQVYVVKPFNQNI